MKISFIISVCVFINYVSNSFQYPRENFNACRLDQFRCSNGNCIASDLLCDGKKDCTDGSDETRNECMKPEIICPEYAFRCGYGACIDGDKVCNNKDDCVDRSDESDVRCTSGSHRNSSQSYPSCGYRQFQCDNGECIDETAVCDGSTECTDRSDETSRICEEIQCSPLSFRCTYGGCIDGDLKCNGARNCADGSDEGYAVCNGEVRRPSPRPSSYDYPTIYSTTTTTTTTTEPPSFSRSSCTKLQQPNNGQWLLHKSQCSGDSHCEARGNTAMDPGTHLVFQCNSGYKLDGISDVFCGISGKWSKQPTCVEIQCPPLTSASRIADCTYEDNWRSCDQPVPPRTYAQLSCRSSFRQENSRLGLRRESVRCNAQGEWEPAPIECLEECGVRPPSDYVPLIVNGPRANITNFPWHATLYRVMENKKEFICGATIITNELLITAAHCIYDEDIKNVADANLFYVATGNVYRDYDYPYHNKNLVHKRAVKKIYMSCHFLGQNGNFANDIAILHIERPFVFTPILVPICLDKRTNDQIAIDVGKNGTVAGFGRTESGPSSGILLTIDVPVVPLSNCRSASASIDYEKFITDDKFCAGYTNGTSVCDGDSGSGLTFIDRNLWYLRGIVSVGIGAKKLGEQFICDNHLYSLYTKISSHMTWIEDIIYRINKGREMPRCYSSFQ